MMKVFENLDSCGTFGESPYDDHAMKTELIFTTTQLLLNKMNDSISYSWIVSNHIHLTWLLLLKMISVTPADEE